MIVATISRENGAARGHRGTMWLCTTTIDGMTYKARHRTSSSYELARLLVQADIVDQPMRIIHEGIKGCMTIQLHKHATRMIVESGSQSIRETAYRPFVAFDATEPKGNDPIPA